MNKTKRKGVVYFISPAQDYSLARVLRIGVQSTVATTCIAKNERVREARPQAPIYSKRSLGVILPVRRS
jgi:hypothetical protein